jgi:MFS transporter, ACS family, glucarate transporter
LSRLFPFPIRWILIFWIFLMSAIAYLDRVNISIAGKSIAREFNLSNVQLGYIFSAFLLGYALFQAPAGRLADRAGPRLVLTLSVFWWALFTCVITVIPPHLVGALLVMIVARFCLGIGEAVMYPASNCIVSAWIPSTERGIANGLIFAGVGFGAGVTSPLITYLMIEYGWRTAFYVSALIGLIAGGIWYWLARNKPVDHPWITPRELDFITRGLSENADHTKQAKLPWALILGSRDIWAITLSYFSFGYAAQIFFNWFFIYLSEVRGLNLKQSAFYTMLPFIAMSIGSLLGGVLSDQVTKRYGKRMGRCGVAVLGIGLCAIFIAVGTQADSAQVASIILAGGAGALYLAQSSFWSVSAELGGNSAGSVSGFMNMGAQIGGAVTASLTPAIAAQFGWTAAFLVAAGLCVLGSLAWIGIRQQPLDKSVALEAAKL